MSNYTPEEYQAFLSIVEAGRNRNQALAAQPEPEQTTEDQGGFWNGVGDIAMGLPQAGAGIAKNLIARPLQAIDYLHDGVNRLGLRLNERLTGVERSPEEREERLSSLRENDASRMPTRAMGAAGRGLESSVDAFGDLIGLDKYNQMAANTVPRGSVLSPSTWEAGEDPSWMGAYHLAIQTLTSYAPEIAGSIFAGIPGAMIMGGLSGAGAKGREEEQRISETPVETLAENSQYFRDMLSDGVEPERARQEVAKAASAAAAATGFVTDGAGGAAFGYILNPKLLRHIKSTPARMTAGAVAGGAIEGTQEVSSTMSSRAASAAAIGEDDRVVDEGTFGDFVLGGAMGAGGGAHGAFNQTPETPETPESPEASKESPKAWERPSDDTLQNRRGESSIDAMIAEADRGGFHEEAVRLRNVKSIFDRAYAAQESDPELSERLKSRGQAILDSLFPTQEPQQQLGLQQPETQSYQPQPMEADAEYAADDGINTLMGGLAAIDHQPAWRMPDEDAEAKKAARDQARATTEQAFTQQHGEAHAPYYGEFEPGYKPNEPSYEPEPIEGEVIRPESAFGLQPEQQAAQQPLQIPQDIKLQLGYEGDALRTPDDVIYAEMPPELRQQVDAELQYRNQVVQEGIAAQQELKAIGQKAMEGQQVEPKKQQDAQAQRQALLEKINAANEVLALNKQKPLEAEQQQGKPKINAIQGKKDRAFTPDNEPVDFHYALVEADELNVSHDANGRENPNYPQELQQRERENAASQAQIRKIAAELNPELLADNKIAKDGAPIIGADGVVESGNGRSAALRLAYQEGTPKAEEYRQYLRARAQDLGLPVGNIDQMQKPVLVRVREGDAADRKDFTRKANKPTEGVQNTFEKSRTDAEKIDDGLMRLWNPSETDGALSASNLDFVRGFAQKLGQAEAQGLLKNDGTASREMANRIDAAIFHKAYENDRLTEFYTDLDGPYKNLIKSMKEVAPKFATAKTYNPELTGEVTNTISQAFDVAEQARLKKLPIQEFLAQQDAFSQTEPETARLASLFSMNRSKPARLNDILTTLATQTEGEAKRSLGGDMFGDTTTGKDLINEAERQADQKQPETASDAMEGAREGEPAGDGRATTDPVSKGVEADAGGRGEILAPAQPEPARTEVEPEAFVLTQQTEQEARQQRQEQQQAQEAKAKAEREAEQREQADREVDDFVLAGSNSKIDQMEARGQSNLFDQSAQNAELEQARVEVDTSPTEAQKEAGNYKKGHAKFQGLDITLENPKGSTRSGTDAGGKAWSVNMPHDYGYIKRTEGADGDQVDVFIGDNENSNKVFIIDQQNQDGSFDEHKVMLGFDSEKAATEGYLANYQDGWKMSPITETDMEGLKEWIKNGDTKKPATDSIKKREAVTEAGYKIRPIGKDEYAVQTEDNKQREARGEREIGGDGIFKNLTEAKNYAKLQEAEVLAAADKEASDEIKQEEAIKKEAEEKESRRKLSLTEHRINAVLEKPGKWKELRDEKNTTRSAIEKAVNEGWTFREASVENTAAKAKDQLLLDNAKKRGYTKGLSNLNTVANKAASEAEARLEANDYKKPEYQMGEGNLDAESYYKISKIAYDYSQTLPKPAKKKEFMYGTEATSREITSTTPIADLPEIIALPKKQYLAKKIKETGIKKQSPGYADAVDRIESEYDQDLDRAYAGLPFEQYNELNKDIPESINRQAHDALKEDFGIQQAEQKPKQEPKVFSTKELEDKIVRHLLDNKVSPGKIRDASDISNIVNSFFSTMDLPNFYSDLPAVKERYSNKDAYRNQAEQRKNIDPERIKQALINEAQSAAKESKLDNISKTISDKKREKAEKLKALLQSRKGIDEVSGQQAEGDTVRHKLGESGAGIDAATLKQSLKDELGGLADLASVVQSADSLPQGVKDHAAANGIGLDQIKGVWHNGKAYIVADNLNDAAEAARTVLHEAVGHQGIHGVLGDSLNPTMDNIYRSFLGTPLLRDLKKTYPHLDANTTEGRRVLAEELVAHLAENNTKPNLFGKFVAAVKSALRKLFPNLNFSENDVNALIQKAREHVQNSDPSKISSNPVDTTRYSLRDRLSELRNRKKSTNPLNDKLRESDKTAFDRLKKNLQRWVIPGGLMPQTITDLVRQRNRDVQTHENDVGYAVAKLDEAMKATGLTPRKLTDPEWQKYHDYLTGQNDGADLTQREKDALNIMREHVDGLTREYVATVTRQLEQNAEKGEINQGELERLQKMTNNIGQYLNRSYRAFDDPSWHKKLTDEVIENARAYLINRYTEGGMSKAEATNRAEVALHEIVKTGTAYDNLGSFIAEGKLGAKDLSMFIKRKQIAPEILALLGEYKDPRINYAKSVAKMSSLIANDRLLHGIKDVAMGSFIFEKDTRPPEATVQLAGEKSDVYSPLNGMWTTPEIKQAFEDAMGQTPEGGWLGAVIKMNGFIKYGKTVLSPTTAMRNLYSSLFFNVANGHFDILSNMKKAKVAWDAQVAGKTIEEQMKYIRKLTKLGVIYDGGNSGELVRMMTDGKIQQLLEKGGSAFATLNWMNQKALGFYRFGDDFWKVIGWENEKAGLIEAGFSEAEAEKVAAERIQDTYPTYSRVPKGGVWLSRFPLAGTFVSFPAEIIRTSVNMIRLTASDYKSGNPQLKKMAVRRMVGMGLASGGMFALQALTKAMFGVSDDEEEALRDLAPPWQKNSTFIFTGRDKDGNLRYFDMTFLDPYGYWKRPIEAILRNQPWEDALASSLKDMITPFLGVDIAFGSVLEVVKNQKASGGEVFKANDGVFAQSADISTHLARGFAPGIVNNIWRTALAAGDVKRSSGQPYSMYDEMLAWAGFRASTFDPGTSLYYRTFDFNQAAAEARRELSAELRNPNGRSDRQIKAAWSRAQKKQDEAFREMSRLVQASIKSGLSERQAMQMLMLAGISQRNIIFLMRGETPPLNISDQSFRAAYNRAKLMMDGKAAEEVRSRFRRIQESRPE